MMHDFDSLALFLAAALVIAVSPGPGILYVAARTLSGGRAEGFASSLGTGVGGFVHVVAGATGVSALVVASSDAFTVLRMAGALYLVWLGIRAIRHARVAPRAALRVAGSRGAFREGVLVEALNPKTAVFFLAFIPQFIDPARAVAAQFLLLGTISVCLNTMVDFVVALSTARARAGLLNRPKLTQRAREISGLAICGLGVALLFARRPS